jgi:4-hydroxyproline epimerase
MAQRFSKGLLGVNELFLHESIIGSRFKGRVENVTKISNTDAIIPSIEGWAIKTGYNKIIIDEDDPFAFGFQVI